MSRRFVAKTTAQLAAWPTASLEALDLVGLLIDGAHIGEHCLIVALGIVADGQKHALGLWDGSTENARVCQDLLANLQSHGVRTDRSLLVILDGSKALPKAVRTVLRAFLRYARYRGDLTRDLVAAVPVVAKWSMPSIPRAIPACIGPSAAGLDQSADCEGTPRLRDRALTRASGITGERSGVS